ncbi:hypothetical protein [Actinacidiphila sp. bgisy160]
MTVALPGRARRRHRILPDVGGEGLRPVDAADEARPSGPAAEPEPACA